MTISRDVIQVGYIHHTKGYVKNKSIDQANVYERLNPGTTFTFFDGEGNLSLILY